ncbi:hypothetical protein GJ744_008227 [Endocarpon pusillum]|uniref:Dihydroorotate dehydrogenase (quinone), mitochondrial n=1 Tax=Endocarpon pusillum TaxID=364733 RepID=A0A8H7ALJ5_9EURO|nr:hypothetical protein GJ744_008227 [Endocarpon pusillum]
MNSFRHLNPGSRKYLCHQFRHRPKGVTGRPSNCVRQASTLPTPVASLRNLFYGTALVFGSGLLYLYITDTRASLHRWLVVPTLKILYPDAEEAHHAGNSALKFLWQFGLYPRERGDPDSAGDLQIEVFGYNLVNPIATSAGIDKDADIPDALFAIGPAIVEVGGVTPLPQEGNAKPRVFRVPSQNALINRYGLNSEGADHVAMHLRHRVREFARAKNYGQDAEAEQYVLDGHAHVPPGSLMPGRLLAVNIAKNKQTPDEDIDRVTEDYVYCVERLGPYADILVVNVSSPNTPGLRSLQQSKPLTTILTGVVNAAQNVNRNKKPAVMVKVSPDEDSDEQIVGICDAVWNSGVDGLIVGNTTQARPDPLPLGYKLSPVEEQVLLEQGGYSGPQLFDRTISLVKKYRKLLETRPQKAPQSNDGRPADSGNRPQYAQQPSDEGSAEPDNQPQQPDRAKAEGPAKSEKLILEKPGLIAPPQNVDGVHASVSSGKIDLKNPSDRPDSEKQSLFQIPSEKYYHAPRETEPDLQEVSEPPAESDKLILEKPGPIVTPEKVDGVHASISSGRIDPQNPWGRPDTDKQALLQIPTQKYCTVQRETEPDSSEGSDSSRNLEPGLSVESSSSSKQGANSPGVPDVSKPVEAKPSVVSDVLPHRDESKVIFASGGITNGRQALEALKAGSDCVSLYTALAYRGVGTISRIKDEMRAEIKKDNNTRRK